MSGKVGGIGWSYLFFTLYKIHSQQILVGSHLKSSLVDLVCL